MKLNRYLLIAAVAVLATLLSACGAAVTAAPEQTTDVQSAPVAEVSSQTNNQPQPVSDGPAQGGRGGERDLTAAAEALGVTVEELQQALQAARPAECSADANTQPADGVDCRADLNIVAETLGVTVEELQSALGKRGGFDLAAASETLGVTEEELQQALDAAKPADCEATDQGAPGKGGCRPDLTTAAETLGVTVEDLQSALGKLPHDGQGGQGQPPAGAQP